MLVTLLLRRATDPGQDSRRSPLSTLSVQKASSILPSFLSVLLGPPVLADPLLRFVLLLVLVSLLVLDVLCPRREVLKPVEVAPGSRRRRSYRAC